MVAVDGARVEEGAGRTPRRRPKGARASWPDVIADLDSLTETEVEQGGERFLVCSALRPAARPCAVCLGVALPPTLPQLVNA